jgi:hypothetical protein
MHRRNHGRLRNSRYQGLVNRGSSRDPQRMSIQTSFAKKMINPEDPYDGFLTPVRNDSQLHLALLDEKDRVSLVTL